MREVRRANSLPTSESIRLLRNEVPWAIRAAILVSTGTAWTVAGVILEMGPLGESSSSPQGWERCSYPVVSESSNGQRPVKSSIDKWTDLGDGKALRAIFGGAAAGFSASGNDITPFSSEEAWSGGLLGRCSPSP